MFIVSLALADFIVGIIVMPISAAYILVGYWPFNLAVCQTWISVDYIASTASILNLLTLSIDRYWSVRSPLVCLHKRTRRRALLIISGVWLVSILWIIPVFGWHEFAHGGIRSVPLDECYTEYAKDSVFKIVTAALNFYVPIFVMYVIYIKMFSEIRKRSKFDLGQRINKIRGREASKIAKTNSVKFSNDDDDCRISSMGMADDAVNKRYDKSKNQAVNHIAHSQSPQCYHSEFRRETGSSKFLHTNLSKHKLRQNVSSQMSAEEQHHPKQSKPFDLPTMESSCSSPFDINEARNGRRAQVNVQGDRNNIFGDASFNCSHAKRIKRCDSDSFKNNTISSSADATAINLDVSSEVNSLRIKERCKIHDSADKRKEILTQRYMLENDDANPRKQVYLVSDFSNEENYRNNVFCTCGKIFFNRKRFATSENVENQNCYLQTFTNLENKLHICIEDRPSFDNENIQYKKAKNDSKNILISSALNMPINKHIIRKRKGYYSFNALFPANKQEVCYKGSFKTIPSISNLMFQDQRKEKSGFVEPYTDLSRSIDGRRSTNGHKEDHTKKFNQTTADKAKLRQKVPRKFQISDFLAKEIKAARQLGVIMGAFTVCFLPYFILFLVVALCEKCALNSWLTIATWIGYFNSTLNPFLYPLCNNAFRSKFRSMLHLGESKTLKRSVLVKNSTKYIAHNRF